MEDSLKKLVPRELPPWKTEPAAVSEKRARVTKLVTELAGVTKKAVTRSNADRQKAYRARKKAKI